MDKQRSDDNGKQIWKPTRASATDAKRKYNSKNYDRIYPYVKKGKKSVYQRAAKASGFDSINDMIESLMDERAAAVLDCRRSSSRQKFRPRQTRSRKRHKESGGVAPVAFAFLLFRTVRMYSRRFHPA